MASPTTQPAQAFANAAGFQPNELGLLIAGVCSSLVLLWSAWVTWSYYQQWASNKNDVSFYDVMWSAVRTILVASMIFYLLKD